MCIYFGKIGVKRTMNCEIKRYHNNGSIILVSLWKNYTSTRKKCIDNSYGGRTTIILLRFKMKINIRVCLAVISNK